jgi:transcription elongation factor GreA
MSKIPMTPKGYATLKAELRQCKAERPKLSEVILVARELGDLSENADYHAAKEKQGFLEGRIRDLESKLAQSEVIDPSRLSGDRVVFGATVTLEDTESGEESRYRIVGEDEADVKKGLISITSPIARALITRTAGDEVKVQAPGGVRTYEVVEVSFGA